MFKQHNGYTRLTYLLLGISSVIGVLFLGLMLPTLSAENPVLMGGLILILSIMLLANTYLAFRIYKTSYRALKWVKWLYLCQMFGFESPDWSFSFIFGLQISLSWTIETTTITLNIMALFIALLAIKAQDSVNPMDSLPLQKEAI